MKNLGTLTLFIVLALSTLANSFLPSNEFDALDLLATSTKTRTKTPTPTKKAVSEFNSSTSNHTAPNDVNTILQEISFFGMGGGEDDSDLCRNITKPTIVSEWFDVEQLENIWVLSCGWNSNKKVSVLISRPDGTTKKETLSVDGVSSYGSVYWYFLPTAFDPVGKYTVSFSNGGQSLYFEFNVSRITKSGAILLYNDKEVQIYNFRSNERVRIFRYELSFDQMILKDWQQFTTETDGGLRIKVPSPNGFYAVVGEKTGEYHLSDGILQSILKANTPNVSNKSLCSGAPKSRVAVGSSARVTFTDGTPTRIRKQPTTSAGVIGRLPEGTRFSIVGGHKCGNGYTWWNIELANGTRGWMAEGKGSTYYLESMNFIQQSCSDPRSRLSIGDQARVAAVDGTNMRIRSQPGFSQNIVDKVPEGTLLTILDGPKCVDGNNWWYIQTKGGIKGWMTESQNGIYLLEPR